METQVFLSEQSTQAAEQLRLGQIIAFPTETVFGLGAIATDEQAVSQVFAVKGRPKDNPLIVHVSSIEQVHSYVESISPIAQRLMDAFWPGPLTIVFPQKKGVLAPSVTPGKDTVAIRMPNQAETLRLIETTGIPLVGPSANKSGKPSPTAVEHVLHDFNGEIAGVLAPKETLLAVGVESTVVMPQGEHVYILRPGAITLPMIAALGISVSEKSATEQLADPKLISPGVKYTHYSPAQPVEVLVTDEVTHFIAHIQQEQRTIGVLAQDDIVEQIQEIPSVKAVYSYGRQGDLQSATQQLYAGLRALEATDCEVIIAQGFADTPDSHALMNRLSKAADKLYQYE
ncbi:threonylcarbamoyl-AMP synthase [Aerococcaceae bacterium zg-ZUI334]|uniref:L-threonylcarbamoyladenylate synthase n=1 Tax=Aerococcaceae bacterium zg-252 TaxID=2796928 RepID=UPI001B97DE56|nr:threonylcarbamoyl-AMP synthase [Aerococcaceae bacterium zg-ZUI334]